MQSTEDWQDKKLPWIQYPIGTKTRPEGETRPGYYWVKTDAGWKWAKKDEVPPLRYSTQILLPTIITNEKG